MTHPEINLRGVLLLNPFLDADKRTPALAGGARGKTLIFLISENQRSSASNLNSCFTA
jgi:hypothetical protein